MIIKSVNTVVKCTVLLTSLYFSQVTLADDDQYTPNNSSKLSQNAIRIYPRAEILQTGFQTVAEFIRHLDANSFGSYRSEPGSNFMGNSLVNLFGISNTHSSVLLNGQDMGISPQTNLVDLNMIPLAAVERIEVSSRGKIELLSEHSVSGYINIVTRKDFQGVELKLSAAESSIPLNGGEQESGSIIFGTKSDRAQITAGVSWHNQEIILSQSLPWTQTGASTYANNFVLSASDPVFRALPSGCQFTELGFNLDTTNNVCYYDFNLISSETPALEQGSFFSQAAYQVNDNWSIQADFSFNETTSNGRFAPTPDTFQVSSQSPNNPTNPLSPNYVDVGITQQSVLVYHRFAALGNREFEVNNRLTDFSLAANGQFAGLDLSFGHRQEDSSSFEINRNQLLYSVAADYIESGSYDLFNPYTVNETLLNALKATQLRVGHYQQQSSWVTAETKLLEKISLAFGAKYQDTQFSIQDDSLTLAGVIGGGTSATSAVGDRAQTSLFISANTSLGQDFELNVGLRHDDYSDVDDYLSQQIQLNYQPIDKLTLGLSYNQGQNIPTLNQTSHLPRELNSNQFQLILLSNPLLKAEEIKETSFTLHYQPWANSAVNFGFHDTQVDKRIRTFSYNEVYYYYLNNIIAPNRLGCSDSTDPRYVLTCYYGYANSGTKENQRLNLNLMWKTDVWGGQFKQQFDATYHTKYLVDDVEDWLARPGLPKYRINLNHSYQHGNWTYVYGLDAIDSQFDVYENGQGSGHVPTWITHRAQINYHTNWDALITLGSNNLTAKQPPLDVGRIDENQRYDTYLYDSAGRTTYLSYTQSF